MKSVFLIAECEYFFSIIDLITKDYNMVMFLLHLCSKLHFS